MTAIFDLLPIKFNKQCLPEKPTLLIITTDCEPDDLIAIGLILEQSPPWQRILIMVGEGSHSKKRMLKQMFDIYGLDKCQFCDTGRSDAEYPVEMHDVFGSAPVESPIPDTEIAEALNYLIANFETPLIIALKPVRELLLITQEMRQKTTIAVYGSFNFRALEATTPPDRLSFMLKQFKRVILYESFLSTVPGTSNSVPADDMIFTLINYRATVPKSLLFKNTGQMMWAGVMRSVKIWNKHITKKMLQKITSIASHFLREWFNKRMEDFNLIIERSNEPNDAVWESAELAVNTLVISAGIVKEALVSGDRSENVVNALAELFATSRKISEDLFNESRKSRKIDESETAEKIILSLDRSIKIVKSNVISRCIQVVLADFALVAILLSTTELQPENLRRCSITFDKNGLTVPVYYDDTKDEGANAYLLKNFDYKQVTDFVVEQLDKTQYIRKRLNLLKN